MSAVELDRNDPFDAAVWDIVRMNRKKRRDYARDGEWDTNFVQTADHFGMDVWEAAEFNLVQKIARLRSLRANDRMHGGEENESVADTYLDAAVYSVIMYALYRNYAGEGAEDATT